MSQSSDLVVLDKLTPAAIFAPGGVNDILEKIAREVRSQATDISTKAGRDAVASLAYKVARSKTALDKMGKELGETHYKSWKAITAERSRIEKELDDLRDEVRKPLTDWENAEKARVSEHETLLSSIITSDQFSYSPDAETLHSQLATVKRFRERDWQEFKDRADVAINEAVAKLEGKIQAAEQAAAEAAELTHLRAEQAAREQKERDGRIAAEAAERARQEAEQKAAAEAAAAEERAQAALHAAKQEAVRAENERREAQLRADAAEAARIEQAALAERDAKDAAEAAERRQAAAIEAERKRVADEQGALAAETAKREADKKHRAKINNEALAAVVALGVDAELAKAVIAAIARGEVPHTRISY